MTLNQFSITNIFMMKVEQRIFMLIIHSSFQKKMSFSNRHKKNFFWWKYEYDSNYDRHNNWKKQFYCKIIFNLKSRHDFCWNNRLSYKRNILNDYLKKILENVMKKFFEIIRMTAGSGFGQMFDSRTVLRSDRTTITVRRIEQSESVRPDGLF